MVIAPNALKGSCSASVAAAAMAEGVRRAAPDAEVRQAPVADGGDGLVDVALRALTAEPRRFTVTGPAFAPVQAPIAWLSERRTAIIEMALASGLALLAQHDRNPLRTTTLGTGELIRHALDLGAERLVIGLGGSATNDGGMGMATALGCDFLGADGNPLTPNGASLEQLARIDCSGIDPRVRKVRITAVCDVENPLTGPSGAAYVYAPQKGADLEIVARLDAGLERFAGRLRADLGCDPQWLPGAGAAGGLGAGLLAFCGAELRPGAEVVLDLVDFDATLQAADLVLTAEGRIDGQTRFGKAPAAVAARAQRQGIPCFAIVGGIGDDIDALHPIGIDAVFSLCPGPISLASAELRVAELLADTAEQVVRAYLAAGGALR